ncbi:hypothetical protein pb186bvf_000422 [Paramecium bursaria]
MNLQMGLIIDRRFKILNKIGQGSFGTVYLCFDNETEEYCACKFELRQQRLQMMTREILVMKELSGISGFPQIIHHGKDRQHLYYMSQILGENLEQLLKRAGGRFSITTVMQLAIQLIDRIEVFHSRSFIHRDIKPENFVISREDNTLIFLIDFGLAKYYRSKEGKHIEFVQKQGVIGTARYASINTLQWMEQSRRDDLEAIGYMLIYFIKGELPWQNIKAPTKEQKYESILQMKMSNSLSQLCKNLPKCFMMYFQHVKSLLFQQQPNYSLLRALFQKQLEETKSIQSLYDWETFRMDPLIDPYSVPDIEQIQEIDLTPPVEDEGEAIHLHDDFQKSKKFMKQLHEKFYEKNQIHKQQFEDNDKKSQGTSKVNNYQTSYIVEDKNQIPRRKESKCLTQLKQEHKENRKVRQSNDDYDLDMNEEDPNLNFKNIEVKYSGK